MNYGELRTMVAGWLHRDNMDTAIRQAVDLATAQFNRVLRTPEMESRDMRAVTSEYANLPSDFLEIISVTRSDGKALRYLARPQFAEAVATGNQPEPHVYSIEDYQFRFLPAPTVGPPLNITILYFEQIPTLANDSDTNWLLTEHPDAYLWGALMFARTWLQDDGRAQLIKPMYDQSIAQLSKRRVAGTGVISAIGTEVPASRSVFDVTRGI